VGLDEGLERGACLAFVAHEEPGADEDAARQLRAAGLLVNVTDRPELCDFTVPSLLERDPVLIAVGTSGASAGLAKQLRLRLEVMLPAELGLLATGLERARGALRARWPLAAERRRALDAAITAGGPLDPLQERAHERIDAWLGQGEAPTTGAPVELSITSEDPDDLTLRQARLLGTADAILHEPGIAQAILDRARADALRLPMPHEGNLPDGVVVVLRRAD
jgi:uroporphyrin-III C-methyltransferase/precorrin-2 dehydrogenase/sirohydrochlorin ferrochelatase